MKFSHLKQPPLFWLTFSKRAFSKIFQLQKKVHIFFVAPTIKFFPCVFRKKGFLRHTFSLFIHIQKRILILVLCLDNEDVNQSTSISSQGTVSSLENKDERCRWNFFCKKSKEWRKVSKAKDKILSRKLSLGCDFSKIAI